MNVTATLDDDSMTGDCAKPPQTIDDMRRVRNRRMQTAQQVVKPYVGKNTAATLVDNCRQRTVGMSEQCYTSPEANTATSCITSVGHSVSGHIQQPVCSGGHNSYVMAQRCEKNELAHSGDTSQLPKEKLMKYITAIG